MTESRNAMNHEIDSSLSLLTRHLAKDIASHVVASPLGEGERMRVRGFFNRGRLNPHPGLSLVKGEVNRSARLSRRANRLVAFYAQPTNSPM
jgi:hypothetical protein